MSNEPTSYSSEEAERQEEKDIPTENSYPDADWDDERENEGWGD